MKKTISIKLSDYWYKSIEHHEQIWALVMNEQDNLCRVYFLRGISILFDEMEFSSLEKAIKALQRNAFHQYAECEHSQKIMTPPPLPFNRKKTISNNSIRLNGWYQN